MMTTKIVNQNLQLELPDNLGRIEIVSISDFEVKATQASLFFKGSQQVAERLEADRVINFYLPDDIDVIYFNHWMRSEKVPSHQRKVIVSYLEQISPFLNLLGYEFQVLETKKASPVKPSGKAQHRFSKAVSEIPFYVDHDGASAEVYWLKRNVMVIKKGAKLKADMPLNQDGSVGFSQRFALTLREEQSDAIGPDLVTTEDIYLKSVNEVGHLLYFAGTNSWLVLKDEAGKTLDSYTIVK